MKNEIRNKILIILLVLGLLLPSFAFVQAPIEAPKTLEGAREMAEKALETTRKELPEILGRIWRERVLPVWRKMSNWFTINIWSRIEGLFKEEIEKRKPMIEEEFRKEKRELKEGVPGVDKSLWERFRELIK